MGNKTRHFSVTSDGGQMLWINAAEVADVVFDTFRKETRIEFKDGSVIFTPDSCPYVYKLCFEE